MTIKIVVNIYCYINKPGTPFYVLLTHLILTLQQSYKVGTFAISTNDATEAQGG